MLKKNDLLQVLVATFSDSELNELCFLLYIDYEILSGSNKVEKFVELIKYLQRRRRIPDLIQQCDKLRPQIDWQSLINASPPQINDISYEELSFLYEEGIRLENAGLYPQAVAKYWEIAQKQTEFLDVSKKLEELNKLNSDFFVGRQKEVYVLMTLLEKTVSGAGSVAIISGEPGIGKSSLIHKFLQEAQAKYSDLVYATGVCGYQLGFGEPYLPFKEICSLLSGNVSIQFSQSDMSVTNANRLAKNAPKVLQAFSEIGANFISTLIPSWYANMEQGLLEFDPRNNFVPLKSESTNVISPNISSELALALNKLSEMFPIVLVLDDLQWSDNSSIELLCNLTRMLHGHRVMFICAFRSGSEAETVKSLQSCFRVMKYRLNTLVEVNLDSGNDNFVNEFVTRHFPNNQFSDEFIAQINKHTAGNALFVSELFQYLKHTSQVIQKTGDRWELNNETFIQTLPVKVEAIIEERLRNLKDDLLEILNSACVEGEEFTAELVAGLNNINETILLSKLANELERKLHFVNYSGSVSTKNRRLYLFRFKHTLIRMYLYNNLHPLERERKHRDIGLFLEMAYEPHLEQISSLLAVHFEKGRLPLKEAKYRLMAAEAASRSGARVIAIQHLNRLEEIISNANGYPPVERAALVKGLYLLRGNLYIQTNHPQEARSDFDKLKSMAEEDNCILARALCGYGYLEYYSNGGLEKAIEYATQSRKYAKQGICLEVLADCELLLALSSYYKSMYSQAIEHAKEAQDLYTKLGNLTGVLLSYSRIAGAYYAQGLYDQSEKIRLEILSLAQKHSNLPATYEAYYNLGVVNWRRGTYKRAKRFFLHAFEVAQKLIDENEMAFCKNMLGTVEASLGNYAQAEEFLRDALLQFQQTTNERGQAWTLGNLGETLIYAKRIEEAIVLLKKNRELALKIGLSRDVAESSRRLGIAYLTLSNISESQKYAIVALKEAEEIGSEDFIGMANHLLGEISVRRLHSPSIKPSFTENPEVYFTLSIQLAQKTGSLAQEIRSSVALGLYLSQQPNKDKQERGQKYIEGAEIIRNRLISLDNFND